MRTLTSLLALLLTAQLSAQAPAIYNLAADVCGNEATSQYCLMQVGTAAYNFSTAPPQIKSLCATGSLNGAITSFSGSPNMVSALNGKTGGCGTSVFRDLMGWPLFGNAPAGSRVMVFVSGGLDINAIPAGTFASLCGQDPIYVAFGNYTGSTPFFKNNNPPDTACGNFTGVEVKVGSYFSRFQYNPRLLHPQDGAFVGIEANGVVWYGLSQGCGSSALACPNPPAVTFSGDLDLCKGERTTITINGNLGDAFLWSTGSTATSILVGPEITTDYFVTVTNSGMPQCTTVARATVQVYDPPELKLGTTGQPCFGNAVTLTHDFKQPVQQSYNYAWAPPNPDVILTNNTISPFNQNAAGEYQIQIVFNNGCVIRRSLEVDFPTLPIRVCSNSPICGIENEALLELEASALATGFVWSGPGGVSGTGSFFTTDTAQSGIYTVVATDQLGCTHTTSVNVVINPCGDVPPAPPILAPPVEAISLKNEKRSGLTDPEIFSRNHPSNDSGLAILVFGRCWRPRQKPV